MTNHEKTEKVDENGIVPRTGTGTQMLLSLTESLEVDKSCHQHGRPIVTNPIQTEIKRKLSTILQAGLTPSAIILGKKEEFKLTEKMEGYPPTQFGYLDKHYPIIYVEVDSNISVSI